MFRFLHEIPIALLRAISETMELFVRSFSRSSENEDGRRANTRPLWKTILLLPVLIPYWLFGIGLAVLSFPFSAWSDPDRRRRFLYGLPALIGVVVLISVFSYAMFTRDSVSARYMVLMQEAMNKGDFKLASTLGGRILADSNEYRPEIAFQYAVALGQSGETSKAKSIIHNLAPDKVAGLPQAHFMRALESSQLLNSNNDQQILESFRWHLSNSGNQDSEQIHLLWVAYHQRVGQLDEAIRRLEQAGKHNPAHLITCADLYRQSANESDANRCLLSAKEVFLRAVNNEPLSFKSKLHLALVYSKLGQVSEAEKQILETVQISKDPRVLRAAADFYLLKYDQSLKNLSQKNGFETSFTFLETAARFDPSYDKLYDRLVQMYSLRDDSQKQNIVNLLEELIVDGKHAAFAHFALSSVLLLDGKNDDAIKHLEHAFGLSPAMPVVCNNLAWMLANSESPKLDEALELSKKAVGAVPNSASFRDTLGTILLLQKKYTEAIPELELALGQNAGDKKLHKKLAQAYRAIGNDTISKLHQDKATEIE